MVFFVVDLVAVLGVVFLKTVFLEVDFLVVDFFAVADFLTAARVGFVGLSLVLAKDFAK